MTTTATTPLVRRLGAVGIALAVGMALPFAVHLVPVEAGPPMGARLLPIFLAAGLAAMRLDAISALSIAVLTPLANRLVTGMPAGPMLPTVLLELVLVVATVLALRYGLPPAARTLALRLALAPAYLLAAVVTGLVLAGDAPAATLAFAWQWSWPGLATLAVAGALFAPRRGGAQAA